MAANTAPIYPRTPRTPHGVIPNSFAALTRSDGVGTIGTNLVKLDTAAADGTFYRHLLIKACASAAATTTAATVIRLFHSTVDSGATTVNDTMLIGEVQIPAISAANATGATPDFIIPINFALESGHTLLVGTSVSPSASVSFSCVLVAGDY